MRVIVTRPAGQATGWVEALRARGLDAVALPLIGIEPPADLAPVHAAWNALGTCALVIFVSANAVQHFFAAQPEGASWPALLPAASTGPGTSAALRAAGVARIEEPAHDASQFDSESLWARLAPQPWAGRDVLVVRGAEGRDWLAEHLRACGARVSFVAAYRRVPPVLDAAGQVLLAAAQMQPGQHLWLFSSSEAVANLCALSPHADWSGAQAWASHPRIAQAARNAGFGAVERVAPQADAVAQRLQRRPQDAR